MDIGPSSILLEVALFLILLSLNAFFNASEIALVNINKSRVKKILEQGNGKAAFLLELLDIPSKFLLTIQTALTLSCFFVSALAAVTFSHPISIVLKEAKIPLSTELSVLIITILLSYITLVLGELVPKKIAVQKCEEIALFSAKPILIISKIFFPFIKFLAASANIVVKLFGFEANHLKEEASEEEIRSLIETGEENGMINEAEKDMIDSIFELDDTLAKEIMTPRTNVFAIDINTPENEILDQILNNHFSRIPVYDKDIDNILGILYVKDIFLNIRNNTLNEISIKEFLRPAYFVPEAKHINALFKELQITKNYMAILIDEYGGFSGIVTTKDLVEEVFGEIFDEYDQIEDEAYIKKINSNTYKVNGLTPIDDLNEYFSLNLQSDNFDTVGGLVLELIDTIPKNNENHIVKHENIVFKIEKVNEKRIEELTICIN